MSECLDAPTVPAPFRPFLLQQIRAHDTFGIWSSRGDDELIAPYIVDKEKRKTIPVVGDPDAKTIFRVKVFYAALSLAIEKRSGVMASALYDLSSEGFGRIVLTAGRLVVVNRHVRDLHRFGFLDAGALEAEAAKLIDQAVALIERFPEVANL